MISSDIFRKKTFTGWESTILNNAISSIKIADTSLLGLQNTWTHICHPAVVMNDICVSDLRLPPRRKRALWSFGIARSVQF